MDLTSGPMASTTAKEGFSLESLGSSKPELVFSAGFSILATTRSFNGFSIYNSFSDSIIARKLALSSPEC